MAKLFFSYSHKDKTFRDELEIHLSMLKKQGLIETWHDRLIMPGDEFEKAIDANLEDADIILLLVSPYFLNSDYCYEKELKYALEQHAQGRAQVIPIILQPCDWKHALFGKLQALPEDGIPLTKYPNSHDAYLEITGSLRKLINHLQPTEIATKPYSQDIEHPYLTDQPPKPRSSNMRIKKTFSDQEKDRFLDQSFEYISNFFENSLNELELRNETISYGFRRIDANHFTSIIYVNGENISECKIWLAGSSSFMDGIVYSSNISTNDNSYNESLSVMNDGYSLYLEPIGMAYMGRGGASDKQLSQQGAAEYLWELLVQRLQ